jgi:hypothetical protein
MNSSAESKLPRVERTKEELANAFPLEIRPDVLVAISALSENRFSARWQPFSLHFGHELLALPRRIYYVPPDLQRLRLNALQTEILDCLFTRHHDGFVRQTCLERIIRSQNAWIPTFVVPLVGEYVVEILQVIHENLTRLNISVYAKFLDSNPEFLDLIEQRVLSYWDCYYRSIKKQEYPGLLILDFFKSIKKSTTR